MTGNKERALADGRVPCKLRHQSCLSCYVAPRCLNYTPLSSKRSRDTNLPYEDKDDSL